MYVCMYVLFVTYIVICILFDVRCSYCSMYNKISVVEWRSACARICIVGAQMNVTFTISAQAAMTSAARRHGLWHELRCPVARLASSSHLEDTHVKTLIIKKFSTWNCPGHWCAIWFSYVLTFVTWSQPRLSTFRCSPDKGQLVIYL